MFFKKKKILIQGYRYEIFLYLYQLKSQKSLNPRFRIGLKKLNLIFELLMLFNV